MLLNCIFSNVFKVKLKSITTMGHKSSTHNLISSPSTNYSTHFKQTPQKFCQSSLNKYVLHNLFSGLLHTYIYIRTGAYVKTCTHIFIKITSSKSNFPPKMRYEEDSNISPMKNVKYTVNNFEFLNMSKFIGGGKNWFFNQWCRN